MKKIGIFTHDFYPIVGGQGRHVYEFYLQSLQQSNEDLLFFSPADNNFKNHIRVFDKRLQKFRNISFSIQLNKKFKQLIGNYNLKLVHLHGGPGGVFLFSNLSVPIVYTVHHTYWQQCHYIKKQKWKVIFYQLEKLSYHKADKIICVSKDTYSVLMRRYRLPKQKLIYIPNGINLAQYLPVKSINTQYPEILYVGRLDKRKGVDFLLETMRVVKIKDPSVLLHIVGEGNDKESLERYANEKGLKVTFHGKLSDAELGQLYKRIKIQVVPSVFEGFGITVLEGMSRGVPVIGTNVDGIRGIIIHKKNGLLVSYGNCHELAECIMSLLVDEGWRKELTQQAYRNLSSYDWLQNYLRTLSVYKSLLKYE